MECIAHQETAFENQQEEDTPPPYGVRGVPARRPGYVANFAYEVVKEQWSLSAGGLGGQGVEQFGRSETLVSVLHPHLSLLDHVHELNPNEGVLGGLERFKPQPLNL